MRIKQGRECSERALGCLGGRVSQAEEAASQQV